MGTPLFQLSSTTRWPEGTYRMPPRDASDDEGDEEEDLGAPAVWFERLIPRSNQLLYHEGVKAIIVREIILHSLRAGDKVLIFSDRIAVLGVVEELLQSIHKEKHKLNDDRTIVFKAKDNYLKMDGSTAMDRRQEMIDKFNNDPNCTVFLLSIKAAGVGINLVGANRVILMEPMWNPTTDTQALFRTYRFGQTKKVFVYRLAVYGTLEQHIADTQLKKSILVQRVLEEKHAKRRKTIDWNLLVLKESPYDSKKPYRPDKPPSDPLVVDLIHNYSSHIVKTTDYDSLLEATDEKLSREDSIQAWALYNFDQHTGGTGPWSGGNPFAPLVLDRTKMVQDLNFDRNGKKKLSYLVTAQDLQNLASYVRGLCIHMPRGSKDNRPAILTKLSQDIYTIRAYVEEETRRIGQAYQQQHHQQHHQHSKNIPCHPRPPQLAQGATQHRPPPQPTQRPYPQSNRHPHSTFADLHMPYRSNHAYTPSATPSTSQRHPPASNRTMPRPLPISPPWMTPPMAPVPFFSGNAAQPSLGMYSGGPPRYAPFPTSNFGADLHPLQAAERAGQQPNTVLPPPRRHSELTNLVNNRSAWSVPQNGNPSPPPPGSFSHFPNF